MATSVALAAAALACLVVATGRYGNVGLTNTLADLNATSQTKSMNARLKLQRAGTNAFPGLLSMLKAKDSHFRRCLIAILPTKLRRSTSIYSCEERRDLAEDGFRALGPAAEPAIPALATLLTNPPMAADAAMCLAVIGGSSVPTLMDALTNNNPVVRSRSALALGVVVPKPLIAVPGLIEALKDPERVVRSCATTSLGWIGADHETVIPALIARLRDPEPLVRRAAVRAVGAFGSEAVPAIPSLLQMSNDSDPIVRGTALQCAERVRRLQDP
jgi:HEAT repeat protein